MAFKVDVELDTSVTKLFGLINAPKVIVHEEARRI